MEDVMTDLVLEPDDARPSNHSMFPRSKGQGDGQDMGQISADVYARVGHFLAGNQHAVLCDLHIYGKKAFTTWAD